MATHELTVTAGGILGRPSNLTTSQGSLTTLKTTMDNAAAAAQAKGTADAAAEIDTWDTAMQAYEAGVAANAGGVTALAAAGVTVVFQSTLTANQLRRALDTAFDFAVKSAKLITAGD